MKGRRIPDGEDGERRREGEREGQWKGGRKGGRGVKFLPLPRRHPPRPCGPSGRGRWGAQVALAAVAVAAAAAAAVVVVAGAAALGGN
jgi:hypothetical protein